MKAQEIRNNQSAQEIRGSQLQPGIYSSQFDWGPFLTLLLLYMRRPHPREWGSSARRRAARLPNGCIRVVRCSSQ